MGAMFSHVEGSIIEASKRHSARPRKPNVFYTFKRVGRQLERQWGCDGALPKHLIRHPPSTRTSYWS